MEIVKKNLVSIIFGVVCLIAVVASFYPIGDMYANLATQLNQSASADRDLQALLTANRTLPQGVASGTPVKLTVFPSRPVINEGQKVTQAVSKQAEQLMQTVVAKSSANHTQLLPNILPAPGIADVSNFTDEYIKDISNYSHWTSYLNCTTALSGGELAEKLKTFKDQVMKDRLIMQNGVPDPLSVKNAEDYYSSQVAIETNKYCLERARTFSIYLDAPVILAPAVNHKISPTNLPDAGAIWDAQFSIWLYDDILHSIVNANKLGAAPGRASPNPDILHVPIKRVVGIGAFIPLPGDANAGGSSAIAKNYGNSYTGRTSNSMYDVYRFSLTLVIESPKLQQTIVNLSRDSFITVTNIDSLTPIEPASAMVEGYRYGDQPTVEVELSCELLLVKSWMADMIPAARKAGGGLLPGGAASAGQGGTAGGGAGTGAGGGPQGPVSGVPEGMVSIPGGGFRPMSPEERKAAGLDD